MPTKKQRSDLPFSERVLLGIGDMMKSDKAKEYEAQENARIEKETKENDDYKRQWGIDKPRKK